MRQPTETVKKIRRELETRLERLLQVLEGRDLRPEEDDQNGKVTGYRWVDSGDLRVAVDDFATILRETKTSLGKR